jgi:serine/threonine protein kinase
VSLLKELAGHVNVVGLLDVILQKNVLYLVMESMEMDLKRYMDQHADGVSSAVVRSTTWQLFCGIAFCHERRILHRDLKPHNILINEDGVVKLADFGLGRAFCVPVRGYTHEVVTLWYRAPEVLLGQDTYSLPLDLWSIGCIMLELTTGNALCPGDSEIDQLFRIFRLFGTPTNDVWPGVESLPNFQDRFPQYRAQRLAAHFPELVASQPLVIDLCQSLLEYNPDHRVSAKGALSHPYFEGFSARRDIPGYAAAVVKSDALVAPQPSMQASFVAREIEVLA